MAPVKECPRCGLVHPPSAITCECGRPLEPPQTAEEAAERRRHAGRAVIRWLASAVVLVSVLAMGALLASGMVEEYQQRITRVFFFVVAWVATGWTFRKL